MRTLEDPLTQRHSFLCMHKEEWQLVHSLQWWHTTQQRILGPHLHHYVLGTCYVGVRVLLHLATAAAADTRTGTSTTVAAAAAAAA